MNSIAQPPVAKNSPGWGESGNTARKDAKKVGREPDKFIAANPSENYVVEELNSIVDRAVQMGASDIHFENQEENYVVRFRIDGELRDIGVMDNFQSRIAENKIRERAKLTVNEKGKALDGRMSFRVNDMPIDMRVSILPTRLGASIVNRILDQSGANRKLTEVAMTPKVRECVTSILEKPDGLFLMTGPTGSGKTSTLYAGLNFLNTPERKILTIEDPVEYRLDRANQVEVTRELSFAQALRASLRQDPDVILVGEIRDSETATTALQAAMTGHLVLSTLHANSAATTLTRLTDLGVDPFTLGVSLRGVIAQRLAPKICKSCAEPMSLNDLEKRWIETRGYSAETTFYDAKGCDACSGLGVKGRIPVMEMIIGDDQVRFAIEKKESEAIEAAARQQSQFETLEQASLRMAVEGVISLRAAKFIGGKG